VINHVPTLWNRAPSTIPPPTAKSRVIRKGPLINLAELQRLIKSNVIDIENDLWAATPKCREDITEHYSWKYSQIAQMICALKPGKGPNGDYKKSEWCTVDGGELYPCDVYHLPFDEVRGARNPSSQLVVYLKFSLNTEGEVVLVLVSCHL
jgi:hypothetical protein